MRLNPLKYEEITDREEAEKLPFECDVRGNLS